MGFPDFETGLLTYMLLKGDIGRVMVFYGSRGFYFIQVKGTIFYGDEDINFADEFFRGGGYEGVVNGRDNRVKRGGVKGGF